MIIRSRHFQAQKKQGQGKYQQFNNNKKWAKDTNSQFIEKDN